MHNHECQIDEEHLHHHEHKDNNSPCECCTDNIFLSFTMIKIYDIMEDVILCIEGYLFCSLNQKTLKPIKN